MSGLIQTLVNVLMWDYFQIAAFGSLFQCVIISGDAKVP
jgi:hypothetical protein